MIAFADLPLQILGPSAGHSYGVEDFSSEALREFPQKGCLLPRPKPRIVEAFRTSGEANPTYNE